MAKGSSTFTIGFRIKADGKGFDVLARDGNAFKAVLGAVAAETERLNARTINFAALSQGFAAVGDVARQLQSALSGLAAAYNTQIESERRLEQVMANTMGATDADVEAIKRLCSAQQELGVIGDEVQLAGAQELATYLSKRQSLEQLIPVMNDMLAQQYGYSASAENAANIATMLGKVMDGQTGALSRYGYSFDEIQESILKTGTESERAAVLVDVVTSSVGGANAKLAEGASGALKQWSNAMGDAQERLGALAVHILPAVNAAAALTVAISGAGRLVAALKACSAAVTALNARLVLQRVAVLATGMSLTRLTNIVRLLAAGHRSAAIAANAQTAALRGLMSATVVGVALVAVGYALNKLMEYLFEATEATEELTEAQQRLQAVESAATSARTSAVAEIERYKSVLRTFNGTRQQEQRLVAELNSKYGESMGVYSTAAQWLQTLTDKSEEYCRALERQARLQALAAEAAELDAGIHNIKYDERGNERRYSTANLRERQVTGHVYMYDQYVPVEEEVEIPNSSEAAQKAREIADLEEQLAAVRAQMNDIAAEASAVATPTVPVADNTPQLRAQATTLAEIEENVRYWQQRLNSATIDTAPGINAQKAHWEALARAIRNAGSEAEATGNGIAAAVADIIAGWPSENPDVHIAGAAPEAPGQGAPALMPDASNLRDIEANIDLLQEQLQTASLDEAAALNQEIALWQLKAEAIRNAGLETKNTGALASQAVSAMGGAMGSLGAAIDGATGAWLDYAGELLGSIGKMIQAILAMGWANGINASQQVPFPFNLIALASTTAALAAAALSIPKFAKGGIAYGPTLGLFGEYAGASNNPEVVAPLNTLVNLLPDRTTNIKGEFVLQGTTLVAAVEKVMAHKAYR